MNIGDLTHHWQEFVRRNTSHKLIQSIEKAANRRQFPVLWIHCSLSSHQRFVGLSIWFLKKTICHNFDLLFEKHCSKKEVFLKSRSEASEKENGSIQQSIDVIVLGWKIKLDFSFFLSLQKEISLSQWLAKVVALVW